MSTAVYDERLCLSAVKFQILIEVKQPIQCCDNLINSYVIQINNAPVMFSTLDISFRLNCKQILNIHYSTFDKIYWYHSCPFIQFRYERQWMKVISESVYDLICHYSLFNHLLHCTTNGKRAKTYIGCYIMWLNISMVLNRPFI